ncbi:MAG: RecQ family ATP-dependent DNA helicase [Gemmatimonadales bacterium]
MTNTLDVALSPLGQRLDRARQLLRHHFGYPRFRPAQARVIQSVLAGRDTLAVLPTGGGKSLCFQIPALVQDGFTIVVSPLIALMQDQVAALGRRGLAAATLNSSIDAVRQAAILDDVASGRLKLLYASPERLERLTRDLAARKLLPALLAVDEAHCIAEWGHDFRPSFRRLARLRWQLGRPPVVALTGSATPDVRSDIARTLRLGAWGADHRFDLHLGSFDRPNLWFAALPVRDRETRWRTLLQLLRREDRMGLVYAPTRNATEGLSRGLIRAGFRAAPYHAGLTKGERTATLERFLGDEVEVVVATSAFGMGIDKPDVRLVVHWTMPPTLESYYQEAGRAGRDGEFARCVLLVGEGDAELHRLQLEVSFPPVPLVERVWREGAPARGVAANVLTSIERLRRELHPERGPVDWRPVLERRRRTLERIAAMERYARGKRCRRSALIGYFGETLAQCAGCDHCCKPALAPTLDAPARQRLVRLAAAVGGITGHKATALLDAPTLGRLAAAPPDTVGALADVPGVGALVAERYGATILAALGGVAFTPTDPAEGPVAMALRGWRTEAALAAGVPEYVVLSDATLARIAAADPATRGELARIPGVGPKSLLKYADAILPAIAAVRVAERPIGDPPSGLY